MKRRFWEAVRPVAIICASILALGIASCFAAVKWTDASPAPACGGPFKDETGVGGVA
jgi:hypothetical protein